MAKTKLPSDLFVTTDGQCYVRLDHVMNPWIAMHEGIAITAFTDEPDKHYITVDAAIDFLLAECEANDDELRVTNSVKIAVLVRFQRQMANERAEQRNQQETNSK